MGKTSIQWTDMVWNPTTSCTKISPGCLNCYAATLDKRFHETWTGEPHVPWTVAAQRKAAAGIAGFSPVTLHPDRLDAPLHWAKPRRIFIDSMSDLFHEAVPDEFIDRVFAVMASAPQHSFQLLSKRPQRMLEYLTLEAREKIVKKQNNIEFGAQGWGQWRWPLPNLWLGVSVENQRYADERIPMLAQVPAAVRFISAEPLLEAVDLDRFRWQCAHCRHVHPSRNPCNWDDCKCAQFEAQMPQWVIVGGESGPGARPMVIGWMRDIVRQCHAAGVAVFCKQLGSNPTNREGVPHPVRDSKGGDMSEFPIDLRVREFPRTLV